MYGKSASDDVCDSLHVDETRFSKETCDYPIFFFSLKKVESISRFCVVDYENVAESWVRVRGFYLVFVCLYTTKMKKRGRETKEKVGKWREKKTKKKTGIVS